MNLKEKLRAAGNKRRKEQKTINKKPIVRRQRKEKTPKVNPEEIENLMNVMGAIRMAYNCRGTGKTEALLDGFIQDHPGRQGKHILIVLNENDKHHMMIRIQEQLNRKATARMINNWSNHPHPEIRIYTIEEMSRGGCNGLPHDCCYHIDHSVFTWLFTRVISNFQTLTNKKEEINYVQTKYNPFIV